VPDVQVSYRHLCPWVLVQVISFYMPSQLVVPVVASQSLSYVCGCCSSWDAVLCLVSTDVQISHGISTCCDLSQT
jgi:hypothetical protein